MSKLLVADIALDEAVILEGLHVRLIHASADDCF